jgi:DNA repair protein RadA/Sms
MSKSKSAFFCNNCGYEAAKWAGKCPACNEWNTFTEELIEKTKFLYTNKKRSGSRAESVGSNNSRANSK